MSIRIIPRLDIKGTNVIKGIQMDGLRIIGEPSEMADRYYVQSADEIAFFDVVASLYGRQNLTNLIRQVAEASFIPLTVTGGIRSPGDARLAIANGADKVGVNTAAIGNPDVLQSIANIFGSQAVVLSIEARRTDSSNWEAFTDSGREPSGLNAISWAKEAKSMGAGEINITSVDQDGTLKGPDLDLIYQIRECTDLPLVYGGGISTLDDVAKCANLGVDGIQIGLALHRKKFTIKECKLHLQKSGHKVRVLST